MESIAPIISDIADEYTEESEGWKINDAIAADWALDKIKCAREDFAKKETVVREKARQMEEWLQKERNKSDRTVGFFLFKLEEFFEKMPKRTTKTQEIIELPSGTLRRKFPTPEICRDDEKLIAWLKDHKMLEFIKTKETPDWGSLRKAVTIKGELAVDENGEIVDGVRAIERPPVFEAET